MFPDFVTNMHTLRDFFYAGNGFNRVLFPLGRAIAALCPLNNSQTMAMVNKSISIGQGMRAPSVTFVSIH